MPKYLMEATYTASGLKGLAKEGGTSRRETIESMVKDLRGTVEAFYYAVGASDVYLIVDVPDTVTAAALGLAVNQSGSVWVKSHELMTAEQMDSAAKMAVDYRPPGA